MKLLSRVLLSVLFASVLFAQSADELQKTLAKDAEKLRAWAADEKIVAAVRAQNAKKVPLAEIQRIDKEWTAGGAAATVKAVTTGACADELRKLIAADAQYGETFVMDNQGALVCASEKTSDYWQGDEAKWSRPFESNAPFIDRPRLDDSANSRLAQVSLPIEDGGKVVGVITVGVRMK